MAIPEKKLREFARGPLLWFSEKKGGSKDTELYQLFHTSHMKIKYAPIKAPPNHWQADIMFFPKYLKYNHGYGMVLNFIEIASRYLVSIPLKSKSANDLEKAFQSFLQQYIVDRLQTDAGSEFINAKVRALLNRAMIPYDNTLNKTHLAIVERVNRTMREIVERFISLTGQFDYIDYLQDLVHNYNNTPHSGIDDKIPAQVFKDPAAKLEIFQSARQKTEQLQEYIENKWKLNPGDIVRMRRVVNPKDKPFHHPSQSFLPENYLVLEFVPPTSFRIENIADSKDVRTVPYYDLAVVKDMPKIPNLPPKTTRKEVEQHARFVNLQRQSGLDIDKISGEIVPPVAASGRRLRAKNKHFADFVQ